VGVTNRSAMVVLTATLLVAACGGGAPPTATPGQTPAATPGTTPAATPGGGQVVVVSFGGATQDAFRTAWWEPFAEETGIEVIDDSYDGDYSKIRAMVEANNVLWDVVDIDGGMCQEEDPRTPELCEEIDYSIANRDEIIPGFADKYRLAKDFYGMNMMYNSEGTNGVAPTGWQDFFDLEKFPGKRALYDNTPGGVFEIALLGDGVAPEDLYPLDIDRALEKLDTIKSEIVFYNSGAQCQDLIGTGEVTIAACYTSRGRAAKEVDNKPVEIVWNNFLLYAAYNMIPKGAPNLENAQRIVAYMSSYEPQSRMNEYIPNGPANIRVVPTNEEMLPYITTTQEHREQAVNADWAYWFQNFDEVDERFQAWKQE
jgi:putative spermidine/putrescine transport system substrate-binding protein